MAHKPESFKVDGKNKVIIRYTNVEAIPAEQEAITMYLASGYSMKMEEKKASIKVDQMRAELAADPNALKAFNEAYEKKTKTKGGKKVEFKETGFAAACKIYNDWKKKNSK